MYLVVVTAQALGVQAHGGQPKGLDKQISYVCGR